jgi:hypothetical protein
MVSIRMTRRCGSRVYLPAALHCEREQLFHCGGEFENRIGVEAFFQPDDYFLSFGNAALLSGDIEASTQVILESEPAL